MRWASTVSVDARLDAAVGEAAEAVRGRLGDVSPDLILAFVSAQHADEFDRLPELIRAQWRGGLLIGCSAGGVIGGAREIERQPGLSLTAAVLPNVTVTPFHVPSAALPGPGAPAAEWQSLVDAPAADRPFFILLPEPFTFDVEMFLGGLDRAYPGCVTIGGVASGVRRPESGALFLGPVLHREGLVGVALSGDVDVEAIVAQGCRPIGEPMFVTRADRNLIWELDGQPPFELLQTLYGRLDARDRELARHSLFLGVVMSADREAYRQGDFLIRNLTGMDAKTGVLAVGAMLPHNAVVQFHLRDAETSAADLEALLARHAAGRTVPPVGGLLFSCLGRGAYLYGEPDHDTNAFRRYFGEVPLGGFFCNGEIGPVRGATFLHGYTSSFGLIRPRSAAGRAP